MLIFRLFQSRVVPYVVEVDRLGEPRAVAPAEAEYQPTDPQIAWHLSHFISNIRSVSLDPVLMRANWLSAYDFATERGAIFLGEYARSSDPFARVGQRSISVQVTSVVRASDRSFQVKWTESVYERGALASTSRWTAILTIVNRPPESADTLRRNPLGLYVDAIDWSRELEAPAGEAAQPAPPVPAAPAENAAATSGAAPWPDPVIDAPANMAAPQTPPPVFMNSSTERNSQ